MTMPRATAADPLAPPADARAAAPATERPAGASQRVPVALWAIVAVALLARLAAIVALHAWTHPNAMEHRSIARSLVGGEGFSFGDFGVFQHTSVQSPPYPFLLALSFWIFGSESPAAYAAMLVLNAIAGAATCAILYAAVRRVGGQPRVALVAAALLAVWPTQVYATANAQAITLITAATTAIVALFYAAIDSRALPAWIGFGVVGCLAALTEPVLLPFMALSGLLILAWRSLPSRVRLRNALVLFGIAVAILGPWSVRNYLVHGKIVPVKSTFWVNVWKGNNEHASGTDRPPLTEARREAALGTDALTDDRLDALRQYDLLTPDQRAELEGKPEVEREAVFARFAKTFIREHPGRYAQLCAIRLWKTLWVEADSPKAHGTAQYVLYWMPRTLLLAATPVGLFLAARRRWRVFVPLLIAGLALLTHTLTIAAARFAFPYEPMQLALVALILVGLVDRRTKGEAA